MISCWTPTAISWSLGRTPNPDVIELSYFGGFTHTQIAEMLDMPIGTVKGRMRLGLEKLRRQLAGELGGELAL